MLNTRIFNLIIVFFLFSLLSCKSLNNYINKDLINLSIEEITKKFINNINNKNFNFVENHIDLLLNSKIIGKNGIKKLDDFYANATNGYTEFNIDLLEEWSNTTSHYSAHLLKGLYYIDKAWKARGNNYALYVSSEQFEIFHNNLILAKDSLEKAFTLNQTDSYISVAMMIACRGLGLDETTFDMWYNRGVTADVSSYFVHLQKYYKCLPKWGGTWKETFEFVSSMRENPPLGSHAYLLYLHLMLEAPFYEEPKEYLGNLSYGEQLLQAKAIENKLLSKFPQSELAIITREKVKGGLYFMLYNFVEAESSFRKIINFDPKNDWAWYMLGQLYNKSLKKPKEAIDFFDKAIELNSKEKMYYDERGYAAYKAKLNDLCISDLTHAINTDSLSYNRTTWETYFYRAECYFSSEDYQAAIQDYTTAYEMNPKQRKYILGGRYKVYYSKGNIKEAIDDLKEMQKYDPNNQNLNEIINNYEIELAEKNRNSIKN